jgi:glycosyltransferase involved in cell wall biosynthesis
MNKKYSFLMSVYYKDNHIYLIESIESMLNQTYFPDEIIIVKDGPLSTLLNDTINFYFEKFKIIKVINLKKNHGLGYALNIGVKESSNDIIIRMDSDDISLPSRAEILINSLEKNPFCSVIGSYVEEFYEDGSTKIKEVPLFNNKIRKKIKFSNPINHPSVLIIKKNVIKAGNYQNFFLNEDYFLWVRMLINSFNFMNINQPILKMRITRETYKRRGGLKYFFVQNNIYIYMLKNRIINLFEFLIGLVVRFIYRVLIGPNLREFISKRLLRKT